MAQPGNGEVMRDGSLDFSGGVDSLTVTTIASPANPGGLQRNQLAWLDNATVRDGGITPRNGWLWVQKVYGSNGLYQGGFVYVPKVGTPYLILSVSGHILKVDPYNPGVVTDLSQQFNVFNPAVNPRSYFCLAEQFLIIQAGDGVTLPLFWDGTTLRRSVGLQTSTASGGTPGTPGATYSITPSATWVVPAVGATVPVTLTANYPGSVGDVGVYGYAGTFTVTNIAGNVVTLKTLSSSAAGATVLIFTVSFIVAPRPGTSGNPNTNPTSELPAATAMVYYMGRIWYAQNLVFSAGDIVYGPAGSLAYNFSDSVLKVTENPLALSGDGFHLPGSAGPITAMFYNANINSQLGQGQLFVGTASAVYALQVPVTRNDWIAADSNNQPVLTVAQLANGPVNDRSVVLVNGDVFHQSLEPGIRSIFSSIRYFQQWGNIQISANEERILGFVDRSLLWAASGIYFGNRLLMSSLPSQRTQGVIHQALIPLDFTPISKFGANLNPVWEGMYEGLSIFQLFSFNFGGLERAFAVTLSELDEAIELYELTDYAQFDNNRTGEKRISWVIEFPAYTWGREFDLKKLVQNELWIDSIFGDVDFKLEFRPDSDNCWKLWHQWKLCSARNSAEDVNNPVPYPLTPYGDGYKQTLTTPRPPASCQSIMGRPAEVLYQAQTRLTITGWCRVRGTLLKAEPLERKLYDNLVC